ncbi:amino acid permease [Kovacikia minuta]|uniref:amino acid permease n=1 Tax=Kovacikia minuta TaxID=2931930 RepID=UPI0020C76C36|nr:amino acid permease [Kovacikia minuta]
MFVNIRGVELTLKAGLVVTAIAASVLIIFFLSAIFSGKFQPALLVNIPPEPGNPSWLPFGWGGVFKSLPYAIWFYLAIEQLPLAAEEAHDTVRDIPKALNWGIITLLVLSLFVLVLNPGLPATFTDPATNQVFTGAAAISKTGAPIADGFKAVFGDGPVFTVLTTLAVAGLIASFHTIIYAYGRVLFSLSRAGYYPRWISIVSKWHTPAIALITGAVVGLTCIFVLDRTGQTALIGSTLINMAVLGAVISYAMVMVSYIKLKISRPDLVRPYQSPLGVGGAAVGAVLAIVALFACFADPAYQPAVAWVVVFLAVMIAYFLLYSRKKLVSRAPEEENALLARALQEIEQPETLSK